MRWLIVFCLALLALVVACFVIRAANPLPTLQGRTVSRALDGHDTGIGQAVAPMVAAHQGQTGVYLLAEARGAFAARMLLARTAQRSIDVQYYIWHNDLTGSLLFDELRAAADRGVRVRVLLDDNNTAGIDRVLAALDAHPNIELRLFNPFTIRSPRLLAYLTDFARLNRRMHNKTFTVDNQATIIGGRNIGDEYFGAGVGAMFVDLDALAIGEAVSQVSADFDRYWASASAYPANRILSRPEAGSAATIEANARRTREDPGSKTYLAAVRDLQIISQLTHGTLPIDWARVRVIGDDPAKGVGKAKEQGLLVAKLQKALEGPRRSVSLVSGYFVPTGEALGAFTHMARSGIRVSIVTNALEATDVPLVHAGYADKRKPLLQAGAELWEIRARGARPLRRDVTGVGSSGGIPSGSGQALHAKTFVVDRERLFIGSFNLDPRSAQLNTEIGFLIRSPKLANAVDSALEQQLPDNAYQVRLDRHGDLMWIKRQGGRTMRLDAEPGTTAWERFWIGAIGLLPIEWLL
jgi:putative cardiolipin synthase